ncbi:PH (Pleckstrin Homology) domain-containing protein [Chitinophaga niastensis]|uniref:PH (Pleckstrin Homology) domain-containing protein n=1 Tax=Chitinophaga niastensis TaxID=536980 RepID=A0A2P8HBW6_CHINA|nr:PH domain-containing protein [Chitinophaga niastensis]PSL43730.1 PH (Pleckstrin Homology) domain-containing protein [Chitinophaga niastensis]
MRYAATLDDNSKIVTNLIIILTLVISFRQITDISHDATVTTTMLFILVPAILIAWCLSPQYYTITATEILIKRPLVSISISLQDVVRLRSITEEELGSSSRLLAVGGVFGYLGTYRSSEIGKYERWCTNRENLVLIESYNKKWIISPSEADDFVKSVNKIINVVEQSS